MPSSSIGESSPLSGPAVEGASLFGVGTLRYTRGALVQVMFWMLWGDFFFTLLESLPAAVIPLQLRWEGASDSLIGLLSGSLSSAIAFFWYPIVGTQSDRHRGRLGRRRPFLLWCTPPVVLGLVLLGAAKPAGALLHRVFFALGWAGFTTAGCTIAWIGVCVVVFLLFNAYIVQVYACLIADVIPQEVMGKFTGIYRAVGAIGSLAFNRWALGCVEAYTLHVYVLIGLLYASAFFLIVWKVKEGEYPPPSPRTAGGRFGEIKRYFKESFTHPFYLNFYCLNFFFWASLAPMSFVVFYATRAGQLGYAPTLGLTLREFGEVKGWTYVVQIPVFFVAGYFVDRYHPLRVAMLGLLLTSVGYACCFWLIHGQSSLLLWWSMTQGAAAIFLGASASLAPLLLPRDKYGQFVSANLMFAIVSLVISPPLYGLLYQAIRDYRYAFAFSGACTALTFVACVTLFIQWKKLGGDRYYSPPRPVRSEP
jgi:MFS family permease